jgi:hypothetical protein
MSIAAAGAAGYLGGMGLNAWGQNQAMDAMRELWAGNTAQQREYDMALDARQKQALAELSPQGFLGGEYTAQLGGQLDTSARNAAAAIAANAGRRRNAGGAEGRAVAKQRGSGTLAAALRSGKLQALLAGLQRGGQDTARVAGDMGSDTRMIRDDARSWASLAPMQEQVAGMQGGWARQLGQLFQGLGMTGIMAGLSAPGAGAEGGAANLWETGPSGGTDAMLGMSQGAAAPSIYSFYP